MYRAVSTNIMDLPPCLNELLNLKEPSSPSSRAEQHFSMPLTYSPMSVKRFEPQFVGLPMSKITSKQDETEVEDSNQSNYLVESLVWPESDNEPPPLSSSSSHSPEYDFSSETEVLDLSGSVDGFFQFGSTRSSDLTWTDDPSLLSRSTTPTGIRPDNRIGRINLKQPLSKRDLWSAAERPGATKELLPQSLFDTESSLVSKIDGWGLCCQSPTPTSLKSNSPNRKSGSGLSSMVESWVTTTDFDCIKSLNPDQLNSVDLKQSVPVHRRDSSCSTEKESGSESAASVQEAKSDPNVSEEESEPFDSSSDDETLCSDCVGIEKLPTSQKRDILARILSPMKQKLIDRVMGELSFTFDARFGTISCNSGGNSSSSQNAATSNASSSGHSNGRFGGSRKRTRDEWDSSSPNDDGDDKDEHSGPESTSQKSRQNALQKFACPYFKRNPRKHQQYGSCSGPGWDTVHRLKQHLYRRHALPIQCARCALKFDTDASLKEHQRRPEGCEVREEGPKEGFDKEQEKRLKSRKRPPIGQTEIEKWNTVYIILFPEDDPSKIPSPFYDYDQEFLEKSRKPPTSDEFAEFEEYSRRELLGRVRRQLELIVEKESQPLEERLKSQVLEIVRNCHADIFSSYQRSKRSSTSINSEGQSSMGSFASSRVIDSDTEFEDKLSPLFKPPPLMIDSHTNFCLQVNTREHVLGMVDTQSQSQSSDSAYGSNAPGPCQEEMTGKSLAISPMALSSTDSRECYMDEAEVGPEHAAGSWCEEGFEAFEHNIFKETSSAIGWSVFDDAVIEEFPASNVSDDINFFNFDGPLSDFLGS